MENNPSAHHPDIRWAIIITCTITAFLVVIVAYGWNRMKNQELDAVYRQTTSEITAENEKKINSMQAEVSGLREIIDSLKNEISDYQKNLVEARKVTSTVVIVATTTENLLKK